MPTELIDLYDKKISFKSLVSDQRKFWQKGISIMFFVLVILCWGGFFVGLHQALPGYLFSLAITVASFLCSLGSLIVFQAEVIRRDFPQHYINWYSWDKMGMYEETCKAQRAFNKEKQWTRQDEGDIQSMINKQVEDQRKPFERFISAFSDIYSKIVIGVIISFIALFRENVPALARILVIGLIITVLSWLARIFFELIWDTLCSNNEKLEKISKIFDKNKLVK